MDRTLMVLVSGAGTTLDNLCQKISSKILDAKIRCVISNRSNALSADVAAKWDLPYWVLDTRVYPPKNQWNAVFFKLVNIYNPGLIILAGYDTLLKIPTNYEERVLNCHPSLLPKYGGKGMYGKAVHQAVLENGDEYTGCTIHIANEKYDDGRVLGQQKCAVNATDTPETLMSRVQMAERLIYPKIINTYLDEMIGKNLF